MGGGRNRERDEWGEEQREEGTEERRDRRR